MKHNSPIYKNHYISIMPYFGNEYDSGVQSWEVLAIYNLETEARKPHLGRYETYEEALQAGIEEVDEIIKVLEDIKIAKYYGSTLEHNYKFKKDIKDLKNFFKKISQQTLKRDINEQQL